MKLTLGTAQFGIDYGISNDAGQVTAEDAAALLDYARKNQISMLDTASAYGNAQEVLGGIGVEKFDLVSKFANLDGAFDLYAECSKSMEQLGVDHLYGYLLHNVRHLESAHSRQLIKDLEQLKSEGLVSKIGISTYSPDETLDLLKRYEFDLVQLPCNCLDARWDEHEVINRISQGQVEVHVRSIFLQGLLLMPVAQVPKAMALWSGVLADWHSWIKEVGLTPVSACVAAMKSKPWIDRLVIGATKIQELEEIVVAFEDEAIRVPDRLQKKDEMLLNPGNWPQ